MLENIKVTVNNKEYMITKGITLEELAKSFQKYYKHPIILAKVNSRIKELNAKIYNEEKIEFIDLTNKVGNRSYISALTFLIQYAVKELYGKEADIVVRHSIDKGLYIETNFNLTKEKLENISLKMKETVKENLDITRVTIDRLEASDYFESIKDYSKVGVIKYNTNTYITLYRLGNIYNYFYNYMPTTTGVLDEFELTFSSNRNFVLRFPTVYIHDHIKEYTKHEQMLKAFDEASSWGKNIKVQNSADLNRVVAEGKIDELIRMDESIHNTVILNVASDIYKKSKDIKVVLLAGPSSSGKTTTSRKLCMYLRGMGKNPKVISMDDYFVNRKDTPIINGKPDYDCLEALDLNLFDKQITDLLNGKTVKTVTYNFISGEKEFKSEMKLDENEILIIEGIHALDNKILTSIPRTKKYKIYISALTELNMDNHNRVATTDNRLLRRIIRDNRTRSYDVSHTLETWAGVRAGEEKYIFPFQDDADCTLNSGLIYEIGVLKTYVEPLLYSVDVDSEYYEEAKRLINFLRLFLPIPSEAIPQDSVLREFIGGSCFHE